MKVRYDWRGAARNLYLFGSTALFGVGCWNAWLYHTNERAGWWVLLLAAPALVLGLVANIALAYYLTGKKAPEEKV